MSQGETIIPAFPSLRRALVNLGGNRCNIMQSDVQFLLPIVDRRAMGWARVLRFLNSQVFVLYWLATQSHAAGHVAVARGTWAAIGEVMLARQKRALLRLARGASDDYRPDG